MKSSSVLYQLSKLNKLVGREFISVCNVNKKFTPPTPTQMQIMDYIMSHQKSEVLQRDLESVLNLRRATVSGVLQTMEKHGYIKRVTSNSDARVKKIIINKDANKVFGVNKENFKVIEMVVRDGIGDEELDAFVNTLEKMQENIINYANKK